jgi:glyceraldehyde-3-phosphate dehydrogenase/erythrose-4-phosphate dehydrogenase
MTYRVAVNGFGRIGRNYLRAVLGRGLFGGTVEIERGYTHRLVD